MERLRTELDHQETEKTPAGEDRVANRIQNMILNCVARNVQRNRMEFEFRSSLSFCVPRCWYLCEFCLHAWACVCACACVREVVRVCMPFPVCLCLREESPHKSQGLSPNYLTHWWMVEVWHRGLVEEGSKKTERVNDGGREREGGPCKTIPLTLGHSQTQEMLDLTPWEMSTAAHLC